MIFGNILSLGTSKVDLKKTEKRENNRGDYFQIHAIDLLYQNMGITDVKSMTPLDLLNSGELDDYLILPINFAIVSGDGFISEILLKENKHIVPVYLGISLVNLDLSEEQLAHLKCYEPIGCRDERTLDYLRSKHISAYLFGCVAATIPKTDVPQSQRNKIFLVDVPSDLLKHIPENLLNSCEVVHHEQFVDLSTQDATDYKQDAIDTIARYRDEASLIVTSRFHAAVIGLALGIPTIVAIENEFFKWSWVSKFLKVYTPENFDSIDWSCSAVDFEGIKHKMLDVAKMRIMDTYNQYHKIYELSAMLENKERDDSPALLYYHSALRRISKQWSRNDVCEYILWGTAENAKHIYQYIRNNYPNFHLIGVYNYYKDTEFYGISTEKPSYEVCLRDKNIFTIVTANTAIRMATDIFEQIGKPQNTYVLCSLDFLEQEDLNRATRG